MTPAEKAKELMEKFDGLDTAINDDLIGYFHNSKSCALIAVDEIISANPFDPNSMGDRDAIIEDQNEYWQQVKAEIEKL